MIDEKTNLENSELPNLNFSTMSKLVGCLVVIITIGSFSIAEVLEPSWQSGKFDDYTALLLTPYAAWPFYIFILYSLCCMVAVLSLPIASTQRFYIRLGLYSGVFLSVQYVVMLFIVVSHWDYEALIRYLGFIFLAVTIPPGIWWLIKKSSRKFGKQKTWYFFLALTGCIYIIPIIYCICQPGGEPAGYLITWPFWYFIILALASGPSWAFVFFLWLSVKVLKCSRPQTVKPLRLFLVWLIYISGFAAAWRVSIELMLTKYATLPTKPPDCYIATAAASGHKRIVKSESIIWKDGRHVRINDQLRNFKCAELAINAIAPKIHGFLRLVYDTVGPVLAKHLHHPIPADAAYLMLKPAEWFFRIALQLLLKEHFGITRLIYKSCK